MKSSKNIIISRQDKIINCLRKNNRVNISDLAEAFHVSTATIRRDISALAACGEAIYCKKNICILDINKSLPAFDNTRGLSSATDEKDAIARCAASLIEDGDTFFINSSSTALRIIPYLKGKSVTIITNNGRSLLIERDYRTQLILIGGEVTGNPMDGNTKMSMTGSLAVETIKKITATKCILGVSGISAKGGLTSMAIQDPAINRAMIEQCTGPVIITADHRKVGLQHNFLFGSLSDVSCFITDSGSDQSELDLIRSLGIDVRIAAFHKE